MPAKLCHSSLTTKFFVYFYSFENVLGKSPCDIKLL